MKDTKRLSRTTLVVIFAGSAVLGLRAVASFRTAGNSVIGNSSGPSAQFERTEQDVGVVAPGELLPVAFPVRNAGSQRLVLTPAGCFSCAQSAGLEPVIVPAGGSDEVVINLNTGDAPGDIRQVARYTTSDPRWPEVAFVVTGKVERN